MNTGLAAMRAATRDIHDSFERDLHIVREDAGPAEYLRFICAMWGWLHPFEDKLWSAAWPAELHAASRNGKCAWLREDMLAAGMTPEQIEALPQSTWQPALDSLESRLGLAYVLEGAQLGSQVMLRRMGARLAPWPLRWLHGYGEQVGAHWRSFMQSVETYLPAPHQSEVAAQAAQQAFSSLSDWFRERQAA